MIEGKLVRLRGLELEDVPELMKHWNNMELRKYLASQVPYSKQEEEDWVRNSWEARKKGVHFVFGIETISDNKYIGNVGLHGVSTVNRSAIYGIAIFNQAYWNRGFGTEATQLILRYAFETLNLNRVELEVYEFNKRALKVYERVGFTQIGKRRQARFSDGAYHDSILMDILQEEWKKYSPSKNSQ